MQRTTDTSWSEIKCENDFFGPSQIQTVTKKIEVVPEEVNATTVMDGLLANVTKEPQFIVKKTLQFKSGMNVLGMYLEPFWILD